LFDEVRILHYPKKILFDEVKRRGINMSLTSFYKITEKLKKPKRRTDCCEVCKRGRFLLTKAENKTELSPSEQNELTAYVCHEVLYKRCKQAMKEKEENLEDCEAMMVFDYKESWNSRCFLGDQTSWDHWHPRAISHIAFVVIWKQNGTKNKKVYNYLSDCKKHDSKFTIQTIQMVLKEKEIQNISKINMFCDVGPHFYNKYILHQLFNTPLLEFRTATLTFFPEHHGKSHCDSAFGTLTRAVSLCLPLPQVQSASDLISFFNNIKADTSTFFETIKNEHIFKQYVYYVSYICV
jgi:hypothetical protein